MRRAAFTLGTFCLLFFRGRLAQTGSVSIQKQGGSVRGENNRSQTQQQTIIIRLLNGRNGHSIQGERLTVRFFDRSHKSLPDPPSYRNGSSFSLLPATREGGSVVVRMPVGTASLEVDVWGYIDCHRYPKGATSDEYSVLDILKDGLVLENMCGKTREMPNAGELIYYVRPINWWDRLRQPS